MRSAIIVVALAGLAAGLVGCGGGTLMYRVSAGAERDYIDSSGLTWKADQEWAEGKTWGAIGGLTVRRNAIKGVPGTKAPDVYLTERYSMTGYRFDVPNGTYTARLHFAETFDGVAKGTEVRVFAVKVQGKEVLRDLNIFKETGQLAKPLIKTVSGAQVTDGKLLIEFVPGEQNPEINGIEVFKP